MKNLNTIVEDIYKEVSKISKGKNVVISEDDLDNFAEGMKEAMRHWLTPREAVSYTHLTLPTIYSV